MLSILNLLNCLLFFEISFVNSWFSLFGIYRDFFLNFEYLKRLLNFHGLSMSRNAISWHTCIHIHIYYIYTPYTNCRMKGIMLCWNSEGWHHFACKSKNLHHWLVSVLIVRSMSHTFCLCNARPQAVSAALKIGMSARRSAGNPAMTWRASFHKCCWDNLVMLREASCRVRGPLQHTHFRKKQTPLPSPAGKAIFRPCLHKFPQFNMVNGEPFWKSLLTCYRIERKHARVQTNTLLFHHYPHRKKYFRTVGKNQHLKSLRIFLVDATEDSALCMVTLCPHDMPQLGTWFHIIENLSNLRLESRASGPQRAEAKMPRITVWQKAYSESFSMVLYGTFPRHPSSKNIIKSYANLSWQPPYLSSIRKVTWAILDMLCSTRFTNVVWFV